MLQALEARRSAVELPEEVLGQIKVKVKKLEKSEEELEKQRFWDELPDKAFAPRALSNWECLADIILERVWEEERIEREAEEARIAAETAAREAAIAGKEDILCGGFRLA